MHFLALSMVNLLRIKNLFAADVYAVCKISYKQSSEKRALLLLCVLSHKYVKFTL